MNKFKAALKKFWLPVAIIGAAIGLFNGDTQQLQLQLYAMSAVSMVLMLAHYTLDDRAEWGLFPYLDLSDLVARAKKSSIGAAIVFAAVLYLLSTILNVAVIRH